MTLVNAVESRVARVVGAIAPLVIMMIRVPRRAVAVPEVAAVRGGRRAVGGRGGIGRALREGARAKTRKQQNGKYLFHEKHQ